MRSERTKVNLSSFDISEPTQILSSSNFNSKLITTVEVRLSFHHDSPATSLKLNQNSSPWPLKTHTTEFLLLFQ